MKHLKKLVALAVVGAVSTSAFALGSGDIERTVPLKDGTTLHVFNDGLMGMEDRYGHAMHMAGGETMVAADGSRITMRGNEVARVDALLSADRSGG